MEQSLRSIWNALRPSKKCITFSNDIQLYIQYKVYTLLNTLSKTMSKWKGNIYMLNCKVYIQIEYVNLNTNKPTIAVYVYFCFCFYFCSLFFLSLFFFCLFLSRCHCFRSFSLLQFDFKAKNCYRHITYTIPPSTIEWQNDQFFLCVPLPLMLSLLLFLFGSHSF